MRLLPVVGGAGRGRAEGFSCHFLSFLPRSCSQQQRKPRRSHTAPQLKALPGAVSVYPGAGWCSVLDAATHSRFTLRTAAHSFCTEPERIAPAPHSWRTVHACAPAPAGSQQVLPEGHSSTEVGVSSPPFPLDSPFAHSDLPSRPSPPSAMCFHRCTVYFQPANFPEQSTPTEAVSGGS